MFIYKPGIAFGQLDQILSSSINKNPWPTVFWLRIEGLYNYEVLNCSSDYTGREAKCSHDRMLCDFGRYSITNRYTYYRTQFLVSLTASRYNAAKFSQIEAHFVELWLFEGWEVVWRGGMNTRKVVGCSQTFEP